MATADTKIDIAKINIKINDESHKLQEAKKQLGDLLWQEIAAGRFTPAGEMQGVCAEIRESLRKISEMEAEVSRLRTGAKASTAEPGTAAQATPPAAKSCSRCGAELAADARFCQQCGAPVNAAIPMPSNSGQAE